MLTLGTLSCYEFPPFFVYHSPQHCPYSRLIFFHVTFFFFFIDVHLVLILVLSPPPGLSSVYILIVCISSISFFMYTLLCLCQVSSLISESCFNLYCFQVLYSFLPFLVIMHYPRVDRCLEILDTCTLASCLSWHITLL